MGLIGYGALGGAGEALRRSGASLQDAIERRWNEKSLLEERANFEELRDKRQNDYVTTRETTAFQRSETAKDSDVVRTKKAEEDKYQVDLARKTNPVTLAQLVDAEDFAIVKRLEKEKGRTPLVGELEAEKEKAKLPAKKQEVANEVTLVTPKAELATAQGKASQQTKIALAPGELEVFKSGEDLRRAAVAEQNTLSMDTTKAKVKDKEYIKALGVLANASQTDLEKASAGLAEFKLKNAAADRQEMIDKAAAVTAVAIFRDATLDIDRLEAQATKAQLDGDTKHLERLTRQIESSRQIQISARTRASELAGIKPQAVPQTTATEQQAQQYADKFFKGDLAAATARLKQEGVTIVGETLGEQAVKNAAAGSPPARMATLPAKTPMTWEERKQELFNLPKFKREPITVDELNEEKKWWDETGSRAEGMRSFRDRIKGRLAKGVTEPESPPPTGMVTPPAKTPNLTQERKDLEETRRQRTEAVKPKAQSNLDAVKIPKPIAPVGFEAWLKRYADNPRDRGDIEKARDNLYLQYQGDTDLNWMVRAKREESK